MIPRTRGDEKDEKYEKRLPRSLSLLKFPFLMFHYIKYWYRTKKARILGILSFLLLTTHLLLSPQPPLALPTTEPWQLPKESLGAIIVFKEESHSIIENLLHLYSQGFSHIRLVDNNSRRELPRQALKELEKQGLIRLTSDKRRRIQKWVTFTAFQWLRFSADWILPVDADEFPHATRLGSLLNYLVLKDDEVCAIAMPMFFFGSSGRKEQPNSILQGFTRRRDFAVHGEPTLGYKTVSRARCSMWAAIHHSAPIPSKTLRSSYNSNIGLSRKRKPKSDQSTERNMPDAVINHYRTQSEHFYEQIKCTRGDAMLKSTAKSRSMAIFHANNKLDNALLDERLAKVSRGRFPSLYGKITDEASSLVFQSNEQLTNPWSYESIMAAFRELRRHQGLAILNAADSGLPDQFGRTLRNAAMLDPTWDCIVRVPPGHVMTVVTSGLAKLCATREATEALDFAGFVQDTVNQYTSQYDAFVAMENDILLPEGFDTTGLREDAKRLSTRTDTQSYYLQIKGNGEASLL